MFNEISEADRHAALKIQTLFNMPIIRNNHCFDIQGVNIIKVVTLSFVS